jgi:hypothetical protein
MHWRTLIGVVVAAGMLLTGALLGSGASATKTPPPRASAAAKTPPGCIEKTKSPKEPNICEDKEGKGTFNCSGGLGEVGFSPINGDGSTGSLMVEIWIKALNCSGPAEPVPTDVVLSTNFVAKQTAGTCPLLGTLGEGATVNMAYSFSEKEILPAALIDPSVSVGDKVSEVGAFWEITGGTPAGWYDSYRPSKEFRAKFHPVPVPTTSGCSSGITSMYIDDVELTEV